MSKSPLAVALGAPQGARALTRLGAVSALKALGLMLIAQAVADGVVALINTTPITWPLILGLAGAVCRASAVWLTKTVGARAAVGVKTGLRRRLFDRVIAGSGRDFNIGDGALTVTATRTLDELDDYFTRVQPSIMATAIIPAVIIVRVLFTDWMSAAIMVLTLPLVPLFMILIGRYTLERVSDATKSLDQLSNNLVELARGLPVLVGLGRVYAQTKTLRAMSESYRTTTLQTLKVAFLSALALELIATISVALVAVVIGVRLVAGTLPLEAGLLALVLAPECYLPLRQLGAAFHATENGMAAWERIRALIARPVRAASTNRGGTSFSIAEVTVTYSGRSRPALAPLTHHFTGLTVLTGASGTGKSTLLGVLAGLVRDHDNCTVTGEITGLPEGVAYAGQNPRTYAPTLAEEAQVYGVDNVAPYLARVGLSVDPATAPQALSPGELRRFAIARALMRVDAGAGLLLVDEPTAHLDATSAHTIRTELARVAQRIPVIAATHDPILVSMGHELRLDGRSQDAPIHTEAPPTAPTPVAGEVTAEGDSTSAKEETLTITTRQALVRLGAAINVRSMNFVLAVLCAVAAVAAAAALSGVSGWLIVHASFQPPIMYLLVAIVGVRFFGLSRSVFTYAKQLLLHNALLASLADLRERMWLGFARLGTANRTLARGEVALARLVADVDDIRDAAPRVVLPPIVAVIVAVVSTVVMALIHPLAAVVTGVCALFALVVAPVVTLTVDSAASATRLQARTGALGRVSAFLWAREDLIANGRAGRVVGDIEAADAVAGRAEARVLWAAGVGEGLVTLFLTVNAIAMLPLLGPAVVGGRLTPELLAVTVLIPLSLIDCYIDALSAVQNWPALKRALAKVDALDTRVVDSAEVGVARVGEFTSAVLEDVAATWPGLVAPVFTGVSGVIEPGTWTTVTGPSGSGKTTLISVLMRFVDPCGGKYWLNGADALGLSATQLSGVIAWCPQESHVFDSSVRNNLAIARDKSDPPTDAEVDAVLRRVRLEDLAADLGGERIGASGAHVSGGQRQRLAVARTLLAGAQVVVLDEPTAHLDEEMAHALMADLRVALADRAVVVVTHDTSLVRPTDRRITLS